MIYSYYMYILPNSTHTTDKWIYNVNIYTYQIWVENMICKYSEQTTPRKNTNLWEL